MQRSQLTAASARRARLGCGLSKAVGTGSIANDDRWISTTTTVVASPNPAVVGEPVTFTATITAVEPDSGVPSGTVEFQVDGITIALQVPVAGGTAQFTTTTIALGSRTIAAIYSGEGDFLTSTGTSEFDIQPKLSFQPIGGVDANHRGVRCHEISFALAISEETPGAGPYTYQIDWDGNGTIDHGLLDQPREIPVTHTFDVRGTYRRADPARRLLGSNAVKETTP